MPIEYQRDDRRRLITVTLTSYTTLTEAKVLAIAAFICCLPKVTVRLAVHVVTARLPLPPCPRCHQTVGVEEDEQSGSSLRWFRCTVCSHDWSSSPRPPR
jgi:hypothetical protein